MVEWDEGPRISTELVDVEPDQIRVGMRVAPVFCDYPEQNVTLLRYRPDVQAADVDFELSAEQQSWRDEVRAFLAGNVTPELREELRGWRRSARARCCASSAARSARRAGTA